jgi:alpha-beta hydrolase superfamily lysophospholipase
MQTKNPLWAKFSSVLLIAIFCLTQVLPALGAESTMPPQYLERMRPDVAAKYSYTEYGDYSRALNIPTYEWMPVDEPPSAIILGIHGLTLHGRRFRVLARSLAVNGIGFISLDMRGFGACHFDPTKRFSTPEDKSKVDHEKSYQDIVALAQMIKAKYPNTRLIALGESLGCTFCVRLAAEHPELVMGTILSAPATKLNKDMYAGQGQVKQGIKAVVSIHHELDMRGFFANLCSQRTEVRNEMLDDPFIRKELSLKALISTDEFCAKTDSIGKKTPKNLSVLILQGSSDGCVSPTHVTALMNAMPSEDQTLAWRGSFGHLQLETMFMRAATINAIGNWFLDHSSDQLSKLNALRQNIADLGGSVSE